MVDPITIIATICTLISASTAIHDLVVKYLPKKADGHFGQCAGAPNSVLELMRQYNALASRFGSFLGYKLDGRNLAHLEFLSSQVSN